MPSVDVSFELLGDPMVAASAITVVRRRTWTDKNGIEQNAAVTVPGVFGSVAPTGDNNFVRESDFQSQARTITVITRFPLRAVSEDEDGVQWQPDMVLWRGVHYLVRGLGDYEHVGSGFVGATCEAFDYDGAAPLRGPRTWEAEAGKNALYSAIIGASTPWA